MEQLYIYIILSKTGTILSKIIGIFTKEEYRHASISLDGDLDTMYSFGRINPYNPFWGGFVTESPRYGTFKRFRNTKVLVLKVPVSAEKYSELEYNIQEVKRNKHKYLYNYPGLMLAAFNLRFKHKNWYYCSEFVHEELVKAGIIETLTDGIVNPMIFTGIEKANIFYTGLLTDYKPALI